MDLEIGTKVNDNGDAVEIEGAVGQTEPPLGGSVALSPAPSPVTKGRGLRKWRRIRRESGKEQNNNIDINRKRGVIALPGGMKQSEGSSSSTNAMSNVIGNALAHINIYGDLSSRKGSYFASRADSENSTGASAPRGNHELFNNLSLKNSGALVQGNNYQQEKGLNIKKKARGLKIKKENSISSKESDSRSSNFVFLQGAKSMTNGRLNGGLGNHDEDDSDDAWDGDTLNYVSQTTFSKNHDGDENVSREEDLAGENSWEVKDKKVDDRVGSGDCDPLVELIIPLHLAQEALEREVQKLRDVGKEDILSSKSNEDDLQSKLEEAFSTLEVKNTEISELESALISTKIQTEYEELMTQRIAAEVEYLVISKTIQNLKAGPIGQINLADQMNVCCLIIQSVLLLLVLYIIVLKFSSKTVEVIPT